jgi:uncharacterized protein (TIGR04255 family)
MQAPLVPDVEHETVANPPLKVMLGQISYPKNLRLGQVPDAIAAFQENIEEVFPYMESTTQGEVVITAGNETSAPTLSSEQVYRFRVKGDAWALQVTSEHLTLEAGPGGYSSYEEFSGLFEKVSEAFFQCFSPREIIRQGLRYIDHFVPSEPEVDWTQWINRDLLGPIAHPEFSTGLRTSLTESRFPSIESELIFRHGIAEAGPEQAIGFLADMDSVHLQPAPPSWDVLSSRFDESHDLLYKLFRWCFTDNAMESFR